MRALIVGLVVAATTATASAQTAPRPDWRLALSDLTVLRVNPLGFETRARFGVEKRLYVSESKAFENNFVFAGLLPKLNPASAHLGLGVEIQPASFFNLRGAAEVGQFFGTFDMLQSFTTPTANWSDQTRKDLGDAGIDALEPYSAGALRLTVMPTLQLKVGPVVVRNTLTLDYWDLALRDGDTVAYEATVDVPLPDEGWVLSNDLDLLYMTDFGLVAGLRYTLVRPMYREEHFADPNRDAAGNAADFEAHKNDNAHQRLGLFAAYTLYDRPNETFNKPTIILIAAWYLDHRYRTGAPDTLGPGERDEDYVSQAMPYVILGFAFDATLWKM